MNDLHETEDTSLIQKEQEERREAKSLCDLSPVDS